MRTNSPQRRAFTLTELVLVIATMGVLATFLVHAQLDPQDKGKRDRLRCVNQLKQVGLAFRIWANDTDDKFPMQVPAQKGGSMEAIQDGQPYRHFKAIAKELNKAKLLACPGDDREVAEDFDKLKNANVSYFVGLDADETKPQMLLAGDRNITNGVAPKKGILELSDKPASGWTEAIHNFAGNVGLADGSVQEATTAALRKQVALANESNKSERTRLQLPEAGSSSSE